jgi:hypothetical protein
MYVFPSYYMSLALEERIDVCDSLSLYVLGDEGRGDDRCMCFPLTVCPFALEERRVEERCLCFFLTVCPLL